MHSTVQYSPLVSLVAMVSESSVCLVNYRGMKMVRMPSASAMAHACCPPAPPKHASTCAAVSYPRAYSHNAHKHFYLDAHSHVPPVNIVLVALYSCTYEHRN